MKIVKLGWCLWLLLGVYIIVEYYEYSESCENGLGMSLRMRGVWHGVKNEIGENCFCMYGRGAWCVPEVNCECANIVK